MEQLNVILHPGEVVSRSDGDIHWIGANKLADLYGVIRNFDHVEEFEPRNFRHSHDWQKDHGENWIHLYPLRSGDYWNIHQYDDMKPIPPTV